MPDHELRVSTGSRLYLKSPGPSLLVILADTIFCVLEASLARLGGETFNPSMISSEVGPTCLTMSMSPGVSTSKTACCDAERTALDLIATKALPGTCRFHTYMIAPDNQKIGRRQ